MTSTTLIGPDPWEPYDPCPYCGEARQFNVEVKAIGHTTVSDGEPLDLDVTHYGQAMTVECRSCNRTLLDRPKTDTPR